MILGEPEDFDDEGDDDESFAYDLFLACVSGLAAAGYDNGTIYQKAREMAQRIYTDASAERDQDWPTIRS